jgi:hypothetical protein
MNSVYTKPEVPPVSQFPTCMRCHKPVEELVVSPLANTTDKITVEVHCHGEAVRQDISPALLSDDHGLASYTVFNDFTSGLLMARSKHVSHA